MKFPLNALAISVALASFASVAQAQSYAANTFGPGQSFVYDVGFTVSGPTSIVGAAYSYTSTFVAAAGGLLGNVSVAAENVSGTNGIVLNLEDSSSNVLESWSATGLPTFGLAGAATTFVNSDPSLHLTLGDTYMLAMTPYASDTWSTWNFNADGSNVAAYSVQVTPEPAPFAALGLGILPLIGLRRRSRKA